MPHGLAGSENAFRAFKRQGVRRVVMAGKVTKGVMYTPWRIVQLWPDPRMFHMWYRTCRGDKRDDDRTAGSGDAGLHSVKSS